MKRKLVWVGGILVALVVLVVGGTWIYINVIRDDPPERLSFETRDAATTTSAAITTAAPVTGPTTSAAATTTAATGEGIDGSWQATGTSQLGYRVKEILFGQSTEGVGRTNAVTGTMVISGTTVDEASFEVDMATLQSDSGRRDDQVRGRIMDTDTYPTASFTLTQPIDLGTVPADRQEVTFEATGDLTLRGTTKSVTVPLSARRNGAAIEVNGTIPIVFAEWGIPNPSFGPAQTEDNGVIEFLLVFER